MTKKLVMIVDDEESISSLLKEVLENNGYKTVIANNGKEALAELKTYSPDLVLMDMMMPGMTGKETLKKMRESKKTKETKVMFVTVVRMSDVGKKELETLGVTDYVTKPFDNAVLIEKVKKAIK